MKKPIRTQAFEQFPYKLVEWKLHDKCNYDCFFCDDDNKLGKVGWKDLDTNKKLVDSIIKSAGDNPLWVQFTGGEPTLYPKFNELTKYVKQQGGMLSVITNGSRTLNWWTRFRDEVPIDLLYITFHSQHRVDYKHIAEISNLFLERETIVVTIVTYVKDSVDYAIEGIEYLKKNTANFISTNAMDIASYRIDENTIGAENFDKIVNQYNLSFGERTPEKRLTSIDHSLLPFQSNVTIEYDDSSKEVKNVIQMMKLEENRFEGWDCYAGIDSMNIEHGFKFRGGCKRDKTPYEPDSLTFFDKPFKCDVEDCYCHIDMITTKIKNSDK